MLVINTIQETTYSYRIETHEGTTYLVVPVVMMVEGVHSGSGGPILYEQAELELCASLWENVPIVIYHPKSLDGTYISANSPDQLGKHVGTIRNAHMEGNKLKAEAWLGETQLSNVSADALSSIINNEPMDVSIGSFVEATEEVGVWNDEEYIGIAHIVVADHLALLPGMEGACNWNDGCGIRVNSNINEKQTKNEKMKEDFEVYKAINKKGDAIVPIVNQLAFEGVLQKLYDLMDGMDNDMRMFFLEDVYADHFVYRVRSRETRIAQLLRQYYTIDSSDVISLNGDPVEVRKSITYETLQMQRTKFNNNSKTNTMEEVTKKVDALINANGRFTTCDRTWLTTLSLEALSKLEPNATTIEKTVEVPAVLDVNTAIDFLKANKADKDTILSLLSKEEKEAYETGLSVFSKQKEDFTASVLANSNGAFTKEELEAMDFSLLSKMAKSYIPTTPTTPKTEASDYSGLGAGGALSTNQSADAAQEDLFLPPMQAYASKK